MKCRTKYTNVKEIISCQDDNKPLNDAASNVIFKIWAYSEFRVDLRYSEAHFHFKLCSSGSPPTDLLKAFHVRNVSEAAAYKIEIHVCNVRCCIRRSEVPENWLELSFSLLLNIWIYCSQATCHASWTFEIVHNFLDALATLYLPLISVDSIAVSVFVVILSRSVVTAIL